MKTAEASILIQPGWSNSGPDHWQSRWEAKLSTAERIVHDDWERPVLHRWVARIVKAVQAAPRPVVLVGHSCGVPALVHAASALPAGKVRGAFLVAPIAETSLESFEGAIDLNFGPYPRDPLPFPSVLVGSQNDPYCSAEQAADLSAAWGSHFLDAGEAGHINSASGHGPWPEGLMAFAGFLRRL